MCIHIWTVSEAAGALNLAFVAGLPELVRAVFQCGHVISDTIVQGSATAHMVPVEKGEGETVRKDSRARLL